MDNTLYVKLCIISDSISTCEIKVHYDKHFEDRVKAILKGNRGMKFHVTVFLSENNIVVSDFYDYVAKGTVTVLKTLCENVEHYNKISLYEIMSKEGLSKKKAINFLEDKKFNLNNYKLFVKFVEQLNEQYSIFIKSLNIKSVNDIITDIDKIYFYKNLVSIFNHELDRLNTDCVLRLNNLNKLFNKDFSFDRLQRVFINNCLSLDKFYNFYTDVNNLMSNDSVYDVLDKFISTQIMFLEAK